MCPTHPCPIIGLKTPVRPVHLSASVCKLPGYFLGLFLNVWDSQKFVITLLFFAFFFFLTWAVFFYFGLQLAALNFYSVFGA